MPILKHWCCVFHNTTKHLGSSFDIARTDQVILHVGGTHIVIYIHVPDFCGTFSGILCINGWVFSTDKKQPIFINGVYLGINMLNSTQFGKMGDKMCQNRYRKG